MIKMIIWFDLHNQMIQILKWSKSKSNDQMIQTKSNYQKIKWFKSNDQVIQI